MPATPGFSDELIHLPSGLTLEASFQSFSPPSSSNEAGRRLAICLHPWSRLGGNMDDPVLKMVAGRLASKHKFDVLRYNSRGVGRSSGSASFAGFSEAEDLKEVVKYATKNIQDVQHVLLLGYSNGCLPASLHPVLERPIVTSHILLSYPLGPRGFLTLFNSKTYQQSLETLLGNPRAHVLLLYGDVDEFTGVGSYEPWAQNLQSISDNAHRLVVQCVDGGTHFWRGDAARRMLAAIDTFIE
ncbi:alpha/beta-hydrolase [Stereum hirsutum FP-91666 SS1]|uniref:alpha/beta-hydrolase n=1 Tax=Stereum hirsutum (strain FP-91666) TaxID=721885 RepID=UPI000440AE32|nr:alpha/beta-hydrolase [Stereum hirsutum FP-91666 SS1]EIM91342.1 alpha/beta-hydrolase [Stereum hirsutum FP-91666 SS1]